MTIRRAIGNNGYLEIYNENGLSGKVFIGNNKSIEQYNGVQVTVRDLQARTYYYYDEQGILVRTRKF